MLSLVIEADKLSDAEQRLVGKVKAGLECNFSEGQNIKQSEMADWGPERTIRAAILKKLLTDAADRDGEFGAVELSLRGAVITGDLIDFDGAELCLAMTWCRFDGRVSFDGAIFTGETSFDGALFKGTTLFNDVKFNDEVTFTNATFTGNAWFGRATFMGGASFWNTTFTGEAWFDGAMFASARTAWFKDATFTGDTWFRDVTFTGTSDFSGAEFTGEVGFDSTISTSSIYFFGATFNRETSFDYATFTGDVSFNGATFRRPISFVDAVAGSWAFDSATFATSEIGAWVASTVSLDHAVLMSRARMLISATSIHARSIQAREGAHLMARTLRLDLSDAEFIRPSIVASLRTSEHLPVREGEEPVTASVGAGLREGEETEGPEEEASAAEDTGDVAEGKEPAQRVNAVEGGEEPAEGIGIVEEEEESVASRKAKAAAEAEQFRNDLGSWLSTIPSECRLSSLQRSSPGELFLSDVVLDECKFAGAHALDKLRIGAECSFRWTQDPSSRNAFSFPRLVTNRRILYEEIAWRRQQSASGLLTPDIAGVYRDLRKRLEDEKNEPEAADFYYGEMEMRRLAGRVRTESLDDRRRRAPSIMERLILYGYWAVSGYGLRAWRATTMLVTLIVVSAICFSYLGLAVQAPPERIASINPKDGQVSYVEPKQPPPGFAIALNFSARECVSVLHADTASVKTRGAGTIIDFVLRLAGPVLLALIVLALRARTKR